MAHEADTTTATTGGSIRSVQGCTEPETVNVPRGQREYFRPDGHDDIAIAMMQISDDGKCEIRTRSVPRRAFFGKFELDATGTVVARFADLAEIAEPAQLQRRFPLGQTKGAAIVQTEEGPLLVFLNTVGTDVRLSAEPCMQAKEAITRR